MAVAAVSAVVLAAGCTGAIMTPIYQTSTYTQESPGKHKGYAYARGKNPTRVALEKCLAELENAKHGLCFSSGMGATDAVAKLLRPGDEVITGDDLYGGTYRMFTKVFANYGIKFHFIDLKDTAAIKKHINSKTKLLWVETPTNPTMQIIDIAACSKIAKENKLIFAVDNTFASPYLQNPLDLGADIVMHSVTKYLGGHSDVIMGALCLNDDKLYEQLAFILNSCGANPGPGQLSYSFCCYPFVSWLCAGFGLFPFRAFALDKFAVSFDLVCGVGCNLSHFARGRGD